jgi:hypothetical protein
VLETVEFPAAVTGLDTGLAHMDRDTFCGINKEERQIERKVRGWFQSVNSVIFLQSKAIGKSGGACIASQMERIIPPLIPSFTPESE